MKQDDFDRMFIDAIHRNVGGIRTISHPDSSISDRFNPQQTVADLWIQALKRNVFGLPPISESSILRPD